MERFPDQESCIAYLEKMRWKGKPHCLYCGSTGVGRRTETEEGWIGRWNCHDCQASFKVTCGTVPLEPATSNSTGRALNQTAPRPRRYRTIR